MGIGLYGSFGLFRNDGGNDRAKETSMANHRLVESLFADVGSPGFLWAQQSLHRICFLPGLALPGEGR